MCAAPQPPKLSARSRHPSPRRSGETLAAPSVVGSGHIYWANDYNIGRANLNGTGVDQKFITGASNPDAMTAGSGYLYWANWGTGTIGRANLNGTGVSQALLTVGGRRRGVAVNA